MRDWSITHAADNAHDANARHDDSNTTNRATADDIDDATALWQWPGALHVTDRGRK